MKKVTRIIDKFDKKIMSKLPLEQIIVKKRVKSISMLLLLITLTSTVSPALYNAQGLFSDSLGQISENTKNPDIEDIPNEETSTDTESTTSQDGTSSSDTTTEQESNSDITDEEEEEITDEERAEYFAQVEKEEQESIWNQLINTLTKKELKEVGIEETDEEATAKVHKNVTLTEAIKYFVIVDNYNNLTEKEKTTEMNKTYKNLLENGLDIVDAHNMTYEEQILMESIPINNEVDSVIEYNGVNYKISDKYTVMDGSSFSASTVSDKSIEKTTRNNPMLISYHYNHVDYVDSSGGNHIIGKIKDSKGRLYLCVQRDKIIKLGDFFYNTRSEQFQMWTKEAQAIAASAAYLYDYGSDSYPELSYIAAQAIIWSTEEYKTSHTVTVDQVVNNAKTSFELMAGGGTPGEGKVCPYNYTQVKNAIVDAGEDIKDFMKVGTVDEGDYLKDDLCSFDTESQDQISFDNNCPKPVISPEKGNVIIKKKFNTHGYDDYDKEQSEIQVKIYNKNGTKVAEKPLVNGQVEFDGLSVHGNPYTYEEVNNTEYWNTVVGTGTFNIVKDKTINVSKSAGGPVNELKLGSLKVTKEMVNDTSVPTDEITDFSDVSIRVKDNESSFDYDRTQTLGPDWTTTFTDMPFGNYTVTETYDTVKTKAIIDSKNINITKETQTKVSLINEIKWGNLKVKKNYVNDTGIDNITDPTEVTIRITSLDNYSTFSREQQLEPDWTTTFEKLPWGSYFVEEIAYDEQHTKQVIGSASIVMNDANPGDEGTRELSVNHPDDDGNYIENEALWANVIIEKNVINDTFLPAETIVDPGEITISVEADSTESFIYEQEATLDSNWQAYFTKLPVGRYHVIESYTDDAMDMIINDLYFSVTPADDEMTIEISKDHPSSVDNKYIENEILWANLKIEKHMINDTAVGTEEITLPDQVKIRVKSADTESFNYDVTQHLGPDWTTTFEYLPVGDYTVTEIVYDDVHTGKVIGEFPVTVTAADDGTTIEVSQDTPFNGKYIENRILWADLVVTKNMINDTAVGTEEITSPDQVEITLESLNGYTSFPRIETLDDDWQAEFNKLPVGKYKITENIYDEEHTKQNSKYATFNVRAADDSTIIYIDKNHPSSVDNQYIENEILWADVHVTKDMINDTDIPTSDITDSSQVVLELISNDSYSSFPRYQGLEIDWTTTFEHLPVGSYTLNEIAIDEYNSNKILDTVDFEVTADDDETIIEISKDHPLDGQYIKNEILWGNLKVIKNVVNDTDVPTNQITTPGQVYIEVKSDGEFFNYDVTQQLGPDWSTTFEYLPVGHYIVEEVTYDENKTKQVIFHTEVDIEPTDNEQTIELSKDHPSEYDSKYIENEIVWANLKVIKNMVNDTDIPDSSISDITDPSLVEITVDSVDGYDTFPRVETLDDNWSATFEYLPAGEYEVTENIYDEEHTVQASSTTKVTIDKNDDEQTIEISESRPSEEDDKYIENELIWADVRVVKNMVNDTNVPTEEITSYNQVRITLSSDEGYPTFPRTQELESDWSTTFTHLPVGGYTLTESTYDSIHTKPITDDVHFKVTAADNEQTIEISKDHPSEDDGKYIENEILWANLLITKNMVNDTEVPIEELTSPGQVEITVESLDGYHIDKDNHSTSLTKPLEPNWSVAFDQLPVGSYKVIEEIFDEDSTKQIIGYVEIDIEAVDDEQTIYLDKDHPQGDAYIENEILWANLLVTKNMINDTKVPTGEITSPDQVEITVESVDGYTSFPRTKKLNSDWEAQFDKLPVGSYIVMENVYDEDNTKQIMNQVEIEVTKANDENIIYVDKDHPVGDAYIENEILWANLLVTKNMINDTVVDTDKLTSPGQVEITVESLDGYHIDKDNHSTSLTKPLGPDWAVKFDKLPVGSYLVTETLYDAEHTKQVMNSVSIDIAKEDDETIIYLDKEHPQGDAYIENEILWSNVTFIKDVNNLEDFSEDEIESVDPTEVAIHLVNDDYGYDETQHLDEDWGTTFKMLPVGTYYYEEILPLKTNMSIVDGSGYVEVTPEKDGGNIEVSKDKPAVDGDYIQNEMKYFTLRLTAKDVETDKPLGAGYEFAVYDGKPEIEAEETENTIDYSTKTKPLFTMKTDRKGEAVSPKIMFDDTETKDLYIYETDVEEDENGNGIYHLNDGGISIHASADVSNKQEISLDYYNLAKEYAQVEVNTKLVDTSGNPIENYNLNRFEYTIYDNDEASPTYGKVAMSAPYEELKSKEQIFTTDKDGIATSDYLYSNKSINELDEKPKEDYLSYKVSQTAIPKELEGKLVSTPDDYTFDTSSLANMYYYEAENVIGDGEIEITKTDQSGNTKAGAEFTIYDAQDDGIYVSNSSAIKTITTNANGVASINLPLAKNYYIKETKAPIGLTLDPTIYEVDFSEDEQYQLEVVDNSVSTNIIINNLDSKTNKEIKESAKFRLSYTYNGEEKSVEGSTVDGELKFNNMPIINSDGSQIIYTITEAKAPVDYIKDNNDYQFKINIDDSGQLTYETLYSQNTGKLSVTAQKTDLSNQATGTLETIPDTITDTAVDMNFYNYKDETDVVEEMPDTSSSFFLKHNLV